MQGSKWSFLLIIIVYETLCGHCRCLGTGVVLWVALPVQRRLCPIFVNSVGLPDIHEYSAG